MISKEELNAIKAARKTSFFYEEKEYLQYIFLNALSNYAEEFILKGGTCLRICYNLERASEDLDFSTSLEKNKIKEIVKKCLKSFELLCIEYEIYAEKEFEGNLRIEARFKGPLFTGLSQSTNTLKIDFNKNKIRNKVAKVISKLFSDVPPFTILVSEEKEILAEKIRAMISRKQARDLYDVWMLLQNKILIDKNLLKEKLKEEKLSFSQLKKLNLVSKEEYETELKNLLNYLPPYEQVKRDVLKGLGIE